MSGRTPGQWTVELHDSRSADTTFYSVHGPDGKILFGTENSQAMEIWSDYDEDGGCHFDRVGKENLTLAAAAPELLAACKAALAHVQELREAWRRGAIGEFDGLGGERSNRNVRIEVALFNSIAKAEPTP